MRILSVPLVFVDESQERFAGEKAPQIVAEYAHDQTEPVDQPTSQLMGEVMATLKSLGFTT